MSTNIERRAVSLWHLSLLYIITRYSVLLMIMYLQASSPACTELETIVMDWLAKAIGLPAVFYHSNKDTLGGGVIQVNWMYLPQKSHSILNLLAYFIRLDLITAVAETLYHLKILGRP